MRRTKTMTLLAAILFAISGFPAFVTPALAASKETVLHDFDGPGGGHALVAGLIFDKTGHLYGTTPSGGNTNSGCGDPGCGVVFRLTPTGHGQWKESILYRFTGGTDGSTPQAGVILDAQGSLYGTTYEGGDTGCGYWTQGCGVVFELTPTSHGQWKEKVLHTFAGADGKNPKAALIFDSAGNLYGTTYDGGSGNCFYGGCGVVFELTPTRSGDWKERVLYGFTGGNGGGEPAAGLILGAGGNIYGTAVIGGDSKDGVVFELARTRRGKWRERVLHSFSGTDGALPVAALILGPSGRLYGTTLSGGSTNCAGGDCGLVFELEPGIDGKWTERVLHNFCSAYPCLDGSVPEAGLIRDAAGNLYGTTDLGGANGYGTVFELTRGRNGTWTETLLYDFGQYYGCIDGANPAGDVIFDAVGNLYGTTYGGGTGGAGVAFKITLHLGLGATGN
jgi:uncharacterized repeat protein (TIGR03803 family)